MNDIKKLIKKVSDNEIITLNDIPDIDLYMDQVVQLFDNKLEKFKRTEDDKVLTKTMINNYVKGKLLMPVNKKKYSKEHILLISIIYELKGILSINDIQSLLEPMVNDIENNKEEFDLKETYNNINFIRDSQSEIFNSEMNKYLEELNSLKINTDYEKRLSLVVNLAIKSNMYRRLSEEILDEFFYKKCKK